MILTEYLLHTGRRPETYERARKSPCNRVGQKKIEKKKVTKESCRDLCPWQGAVKEERFLHPGRPLTNGEISQDRGRALDPWRRTQQPVCNSQNGERPAQTVSATSQHSPAWDVFTSVSRGWVLKLVLQRSDLVRGVGLAAWKQPAGAGVWCSLN